MPQPLTSSDLIFPHPSNTPTLSSTLSSLKRSALSLTNRLTSITADSAFVTSVASAYNLPLVANERCGNWYIPPPLKASSVYFKSTDGHAGEWAFSLRRLNLQLLDVVGECGGCVVVDSTRRGKSMPDALSKTVPFWCCVVNRAVFGEERGEEVLGLFTPPGVVSGSEEGQMERRVDGFVRLFLDICKPDVLALRAKLKKPLRPLWVTQSSTLPHTVPDFPDFHPVVLCTASRRVRGGEASEGGYIQGAADDHEAWSQGLTPALFWSNKDDLLQTNEQDLPLKIASLVSNDRITDAVTTLIKPTTTLYVSAAQNIDLTPFDTVISCTPHPLPQPLLKNAAVKTYLHLPCQTGKLGSRDLRTQLAAVRSLPPRGKTLICCPTGTDLAVGTALAYLCLHVADDGTLNPQPREARHIDKPFIKQRLSWITTSNPALNPSRATLQSVNTVLMSSPLPTTAALAEPRNPADFTAEWTPAPHSPQIQPALFAALRASAWRFTRTLRSAHPSQPSGRVTGTATFAPTCIADTLLYSESGEFVTDTGMRFAARRRYVYQLIPTSASESGTREGEEEEEPFIRIRFFDDSLRRDDISEKGEGVGGVFVEMGEVSADLEAVNRARHLCGEDVYAARWGCGRGMLGGEEEGERWWEVRYDVEGPGKGYVSTTRYTPQTE